MQFEYSLAEKVAIRTLVQQKDDAQQRIDAILATVLERIPVPKDKILSSGGLEWGLESVTGDDAKVFIPKPAEKKKHK
jgi:hypothetical protein